jgi:Kef-type K+ transport system membrane component KefB
MFGGVMILTFALLGSVVARRLKIPTAIGKLMTGVLIGNLLYLWGYDRVVILREGATCTDIAGSDAARVDDCFTAVSGYF